MRVLAVIGKFLVSVGVGVLLFVGWTLWGTGIYTARQQDDLERQFALLPTLAASTSGPEEQPGPPKNFAPGPGEPVFKLRIPSIDLSHVVVEGVGVEELRTGPGHYPSCRPGFERPLCTDFDEVFPGELGRVIVSGHRTTYGAPFWDLDKLEPGDRIFTETQWGDFVYQVTKIEIVEPSSLAIAIQSDKAEIALTTCNPRYSAEERLIVFGELEEIEAA